MSQAESPFRNRFVVLFGVVVVAVSIAWLLLLPKQSARTVAEAGPRAEAPNASEPPVASPELPRAPPAPTPTPSAVVSAPAVVDAAPVVTAIVPEALPEVDAFSKLPPESARWTPDERQHYMDGLFEKLARREALLERELAAATQANDVRTADQKRATLEQLRARRDDLLAGTRTRPPRADAEP